MFDKYKNGAWQEPENTVQRNASGAWTECEFARREISGAWENVWEAIQYMSELNYSLPSGSIVGYISSTSADKEGWAIWYFESGDTDGGSVTYYIDGEFTNPSISFDYDGFFGYMNNGTQSYSSVGSLDIYTRSTGGAENYTKTLDTIRVTEGYESYSTTLNGIFNRVGFRFKFQNWNVSTNMSPQYLFNIYNILIDGKDCIPAKEYER